MIRRVLHARDSRRTSSKQASPTLEGGASGSPSRWSAMMRTCLEGREKEILLSPDSRILGFGRVGLNCDPPMEEATRLIGNCEVRTCCLIPSKDTGSLLATKRFASCSRPFHQYVY